MSSSLALISSMATRRLLTALTDAYRTASGQVVHVESVGGVDATRRLLAGEMFDVVVLAIEAIHQLEAAGRLQQGSILPIADSVTAIAVRAGTPVPDISSEAALRAAVLQASTIGYSTGPSGTALIQLFQRWGLHDMLAGRLVQARAGVPVGVLVATGEAELGFQQRSELMDLPGTVLVGDMPPELGIVSRFCGAVLADAAQPHVAQSLLRFMALDANDAVKVQHGMRAGAPPPGWQEHGARPPANFRRLQ